MALERAKQVQLRDKLGSWDSQLAQLTPRQKEGFVALSSVANFRALPAELPLGEDLGHEGGSGPQEGGPKELETPLKCMEWFDEVESQFEAEQEGCYRAYSRQLGEYQEQCASMLSEISQALRFLQEIQDKHKLVSNKTGALHHACEQLMEDQVRLMNIAENVSNKLSYFNELEWVSTKLNSPALSVGSDSFVAMLARLDECIAFLEQNPHFKESQSYLVRYKQYLTRALSIIKQHVVFILKSTAKSLLPQQGLVEALSENSYAQYYGKFRSSAPKIKALMKEIEQRSENNAEYRTLLQDCHQCYISQRGLLLTPTVTTSIEELNRAHGSDHCGLVRSGCNFLSRVCQDEYQLFFHFFCVDSPQLNGLLESLCYSLYDVLRPVIIHINHLETLAEVCSILKVEILEGRVKERSDELAAFGGVIQQMLQDVQQRLVFRARRFIQTDIRGYSPAPGDLAYPDKLIVAAQAISDQDPSSDSVFDTSGTESDSQTPETAQPVRRKRRQPRQGAVDVHAMWYPTVRRTLLCLSKLYRCIEKSVFEGVAQEALAECIQSLLSASDAIKSKKQPMDGQLFLIKHFLILREQIAAFDVDFAVREVSLDWTRTKAAAYGLLKKRSRLFSLGGNNAVLEFFLEGVPEIVETHLDSKKEVDMQLKHECEQFISDASALLLHPVKHLLSKYDVIVQVAERDQQDPGSLVHRQPFAAAGEVHKVVVDGSKLLKAKVPAMRRSLALYLANEETEHILFRPVRASVLNTYEALEKTVTRFYSSEDQYIISCPSQDQVSLMLTVEASPLSAEN